MPFVYSGPMVGFSGTLDGLTYSQTADGRTMVKRKNRKRVKPATPDQIRVMNDTRLCSAFVRPLKEFIRVGYALEAKTQCQNPNNAMVPELRKNAITGEGTDRHIDFSAVLVAKGHMAKTTDISVSGSEQGIEVMWATEESDSSMHWSDQVVLLAYFPRLKEARYITAGPERHTGTATLQFRGIKKGYSAHLYCAFRANDGSSISNSVYLGQTEW